MKTKRKLVKIISLSLFISIFMLAGQVLGANFVANKQEYTDAYKNWAALSEEEKSKTIMPSPFPIKLTKNNTNMVRARATLPTTYNLKDVITIPVKHQGSTSECWAFSMTSILESNISLKSGTTSPRYSERFMDYATSQTFLDGINEKGFSREVKSGGNSPIALAYYTNGTGAVLEKDMPFQDNENRINLSEIQNKKPVTKVNEANIFPTIYKYKDENGKTVCYDGTDTVFTDAQVNAVRNSVKQYIMENGAISAVTYGNGAEYYSDAENPIVSKSYYCDSKTANSDHAITIVGWDDNYAVDNFKVDHRPTKPGAYIVLNSYGTESFDKGFLYVSYEDALIEAALAGIESTEQITYDKIYQHDFYGYTWDYYPELTDGNQLTSAYVANIYERDTTKKEELQEVTVAMPVGMNVEIYVAQTGENIDISQAQKAEIESNITKNIYTTFKLKTPIELKNKQFAIIIKITNTEKAGMGVEMNLKTNAGISTAYDNVTSKEGESFISIDGKQWEDFYTILKDANFCIKGFTKVAEEIKEPNDNKDDNKQEENKQPANTTDNKKNDNTTAPGVLPNAGRIGIGIAILTVLTIGIVSYINYRRFKIIK